MRAREPKRSLDTYVYAFTYYFTQRRARPSKHGAASSVVPPPPPLPPFHPEDGPRLHCMRDVCRVLSSVAPACACSTHAFIPLCGTDLCW